MEHFLITAKEVLLDPHIGGLLASFIALAAVYSLFRLKNPEEARSSFLTYFLGALIIYLSFVLSRLNPDKDIVIVLTGFLLSLIIILILSMR